MQACRLATLLKRDSGTEVFLLIFAKIVRTPLDEFFCNGSILSLKVMSTSQVYPLWSPIKKLSWNTSWKCSSLRSTFLWFSFQLFHANLDPPPVIKRYKVRKNTQIFYNISNFLTMFQMSYICNQVAILAYKVLIKKHMDY